MVSSDFELATTYGPFFYPAIIPPDNKLTESQRQDIPIPDSVISAQDEETIDKVLAEHFSNFSL